MKMYHIILDPMNGCSPQDFGNYKANSQGEAEDMARADYPDAHGYFRASEQE